MFKVLTCFLAFSLVFPPVSLAGDDSSWRKPYRANFKSPEHYTSLERLQQREKDLERWIQRNKPVTYSLPKEIAPKIKPPEKVKIPEPPKPKFDKLETPNPSLSNPFEGYPKINPNYSQNPRRGVGEAFFAPPSAGGVTKNAILTRTSSASPEKGVRYAHAPRTDYSGER